MVMSLKFGRPKLNQTQQFADYGYEVLVPRAAKLIIEEQGGRKLPVREAREADLKAIFQLSNEINNIHYSHMPHDFAKPDGSNRDEPYWRGFMNVGDSAVFVTEDNGVLTGVVAVSVSTSTPYPFLTSRPRGHVATIVVAESHRGRGLGRELMSAAETYAKEKGAEDIKLEVMEFNADALNFYRELGYKNFSFRLSKPLP